MTRIQRRRTTTRRRNIPTRNLPPKKTISNWSSHWFLSLFFCFNARVHVHPEKLSKMCFSCFLYDDSSTYYIYMYIYVYINIYVYILGGLVCSTCHQCLNYYLSHLVMVLHTISSVLFVFSNSQKLFVSAFVISIWPEPDIGTD